MRSRILLALAVLLPAVPGLAQTLPTVSVPPSLETQPVFGSGTAVQGAAIWVNPNDPSRSLLLVGDNQNGLMLYNSDGGARLASVGAVQGVDVQDGVIVAGAYQQLVMVVNTTSGLVSYVIDPTTLSLNSAGLPNFGTGSTVANSVALFKSPDSKLLYAFAGGASGPLSQFEINLPDAGTDAGGGMATLVRSWDAGSVTGLTVDDSLKKLYVAVRNSGIYQYDAEPDAGVANVLVDGADGGLTTPVMGMALYTAGNTDGYLLAVNGSDNAVRVYDRNPANHRHVGNFTVDASTPIDSVEAPRVLAITNRPVLPGFALGMVAVQDSANTGSNENFKLVPWETVANAFSPQLLVSTGNTTPPADAGVDGGTDGGGGSGGGGTDPGNPMPPHQLPDYKTGCGCSSASLPGTMLLGLAAVLLARRRRQE